MREMKDSGVEWIGSVPTSWNIMTVGSLLKVRNEIVNDTDYPPLSVTKDGIVPQMKNVAKSDATDNRKMVLANDFVINSRSDRKQSCGVSPFDGSVSLINIVLYPTERAPVVPAYLNYLMKNNSFAEEFYRHGHGIVADLWTTRWQEMKSILLPVPPMEEQQRILETVSTRTKKVDALIANQQTQIEKLKAYKQSLITEVVTKGLDPDVPMKDSGVEWIGMIPNKWRISRIGLHYSIVLGKMLCPRQTDSTYTLEEYFCAANVHFGEICTDELKEMWFSPTEKRQYHIETGDMLIVEGGAGAGGCAIVQSSTSALAQNSIMIVRNLRGTDNRYLCYFIESLVKRGYIDVICNKATIPHFTKEKLSKTQFPVCSQEDQILISDYLDKKCSKIDRLISLKQTRIEKLEQYKKSLIFEYVTGKKEANN